MIRLSKSEKLLSFINISLLALFALLTFYPFYYVLIYSLSDQTQAINAFLYPQGFTLDAFARLFAKEEIVMATIISVSRTVLGTLISLVVTSMIAYAVSKRNMPFRKFINTACILTMYFGAGLIPWYLTMRFLGFYDNYFVYIIPGAMGVFNMLLIKTYFEQLPQEMEESAFVDGAGYMRIFMQIVLPVSLPILATVAVFNAVGAWNAWSDNLFLVPSKNLRTLQFMLYQVLRESSATIQINDLENAKQLANRLSPKTLQMAITIVVSMPICIVYPLFQRYFMSGLMVGAIKG